MHFDWWTLAIQTVNFAVLVWLLNRFLYKPVLQMIDARKAEMQKHYDAAQAAQAQAAARLAALEAERAGIAAERETALKAAAASAEEAAARRRAESERDAAAMLDAARQTLATERKEALAEARRTALDLGSLFAQRLLAEVPPALRAEAWLEHIEAYIRGLAPAERDRLVQQLSGTNAVQVVTATELPPAVAETWRSRLQQSLGAPIAVTFSRDAKLVAGAELHFPGAILRFSWQSALAAMRKEIDADDDAG